MNNKKSDSNLRKSNSTTNILDGKNNSLKTKKNVSKTQSLTKQDKFEDFKKQIFELQQNNTLDKLKNTESYFEIMNNDWIINNNIARYGICNEESPENTLSAYKEAVNRNYPILISLRALKDETIVCFKDSTLTKLSADGYISNLTLSEVKDLRVLKSNESVPTLFEALELIQGNVPIIFEIFNESIVGKFEENILKTLEEYSMKYNAQNKIAVMSMNPFTLNWFYCHAPWITRIIKSCSFKSLKTYANIKTSKLRKLKLHKICHADFVCYNAKDLPNNYVYKVKPVGLIAYNVTTQTQYEELLTITDNVIFDGFIPQI